MKRTGSICTYRLMTEKKSNTFSPMPSQSPIQSCYKHTSQADRVANSNPNANANINYLIQSSLLSSTIGIPHAAGPGFVSSATTGVGAIRLLFLS